MDSVADELPKIPFGTWRATYMPGQWVVLAGPMVLLALPPAPPTMAEWMSRVWEQIIAANDADKIANILASFNILSMRDLCLFVKDESGIHSIVRGSIVITDPDTGQVLSSAVKAPDWRNLVPSQVNRVAINLTNTNTQGLMELPLASGGVYASRIILDFDPSRIPTQPARLSKLARLIDSKSVSELSENNEVVDEEQPQENSGQSQQNEPQTGFDLTGNLATTGSNTPPAPAANIDQPNEPVQLENENLGDVFSAADGQTTAVLPEMSPSFDNQMMFENSTSRAETPLDPSIVPSGSPARAAEPMLGQAGPITAVPLNPNVPTSQEKPQDSLAGLAKPPMVLATFCSSGHANPPAATYCRSCGQGVTSNPQLIQAPSLALLQMSTGDQIELDRPVLVGRAPANVNQEPNARLVRVLSPSHDISRTHVRIRPNNWSIEVTDLNSTNGTTVLIPRREPVALQPGETIAVSLGTLVDIGDGARIQILPPR